MQSARNQATTRDWRSLREEIDGGYRYRDPQGETVGFELPLDVAQDVLGADTRLMMGQWVSG